jgi:hypothetical protein
MDALRHEAHAGLSLLASAGETAKYRQYCYLVYYEYGLPFAGQARFHLDRRLLALLPQGGGDRPVTHAQIFRG